MRQLQKIIVSGAEQSRSERAVGAHRIPINPLMTGSQDTKIPAMSFPYT
jgi:hypothetical protein